jgi:hypothetical protein
MVIGRLTVHGVSDAEGVRISITLPLREYDNKSSKVASSNVQKP